MQYSVLLCRCLSQECGDHTSSPGLTSSQHHYWGCLESSISALCYSELHSLFFECTMFSCLRAFSQCSFFLHGVHYIHLSFPFTGDVQVCQQRVAVLFGRLPSSTSQSCRPQCHPCAHWPALEGTGAPAGIFPFLRNPLFSLSGERDGSENSMFTKQYVWCNSKCMFYIEDWKEIDQINWFLWRDF